MESSTQTVKRSLAPKRERFAPMIVAEAGTVKHRKSTGGYHDVPLFRGADRYIMRATKRLAEKPANYLHEGGPL